MSSHVKLPEGIGAGSIEFMLHWVKEREAVRIRKERGDPFPWTNDPIIGTYRFCNVRREDDRVTKWIAENIRVRFADNRNLWLMLCIARQINWPDTLLKLISSGNLAWPVDDAFRPKIMADVLNGIAATGGKVFTGAYIITAPPDKGAKKTDHVALNTIGRLWHDRSRFESLFRSQPYMRRVHSELVKYDGWGPFLAYQAVVDMRFTHLLRDAPDVRTWAAAGPGTIRGLNRVAGRPTDGTLSQDRALREIVCWWPKLVGETGVQMDISDVPNVMCETDKYLRVRNGEGKPRASYVPGRGS